MFNTTFVFYREGHALIKVFTGFLMLTLLSCLRFYRFFISVFSMATPSGVIFTNFTVLFQPFGWWVLGLYLFRDQIYMFIYAFFHVYTRLGCFFFVMVSFYIYFLHIFTMHTQTRSYVLRFIDTTPTLGGFRLYFYQFLRIFNEPTTFVFYKIGVASIKGF